MSALLIESGELPQDIPPDHTEANSGDAPPSESSNGKVTEWYNSDFPFSTPENPYGYFDGADGEPDFSRPRKKRPHGYTGDAKPSPGKKSGGNSSVTRRTAATDIQARQAASLLSTMNGFIGMGLAVFGLPMTAAEMTAANKDFEEAAYAALLNDPALCRKILSAGGDSGKAQLILAYVGFGAQIAPVAWSEFKERKGDDA